MQTRKMNWAVLCLILCTVKFMQHLSYFLLECLKIFTSEAMYTINYVCEKIVILYSTYFIVQEYSYLSFSHSVALFVKWLVRFFYIIGFIGIKLYIVRPVGLRLQFCLSVHSLVMLSLLGTALSLKSCRPTGIWETINNSSFKPPRFRRNYFTLVNQ